MSTHKQYEAFQYEAFTRYAIPPAVIDLGRDWVIDNGAVGELDPKSNLGYGELGKMTDYDHEMKEFALWKGLDGYKETQRFMKSKRGLGRGPYRELLKLFHLFRIKCKA